MLVPGKNVWVAAQVIFQKGGHSQQWSVTGEST